MSREVYKNITLPPNNVLGGGRDSSVKNKRSKVRKLPKGLTVVHIGGKIWSIGKLNAETKHRVIYAPDNKEYHLYGNDAFKLNGFDCSRANHSLVKIHILTNILDGVENWCFDLSKKPKTGDMVKVIYHNGTVKNIVFGGEFEKVRKKKYLDFHFDSDYQYMCPVGYRIK